MRLSLLLNTDTKILDPLILDKLARQPWLILPSVHDSMLAQLLSKMGASWGAQQAQAEPTDAELADPRMPREVVNYWGERRTVDYFRTMEGAPGVARIASLGGIIGKRLTHMELDCGACSVDHFMMALDLAADDDAIEAIVVDFNSPGGVSTGVPEAARHVSRVVERSGKRVIGWTETKSCSASQWIMAACPEVYVAPSARVGSIGVYMSWLDTSEEDKKAGRRRELFEAGDHKAMGLRPLTAQERALLQAEADGLHEQFKAAVLQHRPQVPARALEGLVYEGDKGEGSEQDDALKVGLADFAFDTFEIMLRELGLMG